MIKQLVPSTASILSTFNSMLLKLGQRIELNNLEVEKTQKKIEELKTTEAEIKADTEIALHTQAKIAEIVTPPTKD